MLQLSAFSKSAITEAFQLEAFAVVKDTEILLSYRLKGPLEKLRIPQVKAGEVPHFGTELWKHSCFEFFIKPETDERYWEWNFSPDLSWGAFTFEGYRKSVGSQCGGAGIRSFQVIREKNDSLKVQVQLRPDNSPWLIWALMNRVPLKVSFTAVIEGQDGELSYWAVKHAGSKADFHLADSFSFELT